MLIYYYKKGVRINIGFTCLNKLEHALSVQLHFLVFDLKEYGKQKIDLKGLHFLLFRHYIV